MSKKNNYMFENEFQKPLSKAKKWAIGIISTLCILGIIGGITAGIMIPKRNNSVSTNSAEQPNTNQTGLPFKDFDYMSRGYIEDVLSELPVTMDYRINGESRDKFETRINKLQWVGPEGFGAFFMLDDAYEYSLLNDVEKKQVEKLDSRLGDEMSVTWTINGNNVTTYQDFLFNGLLISISVEDDVVYVERATGLSLTENIPITKLEIVYDFSYTVHQ